MRSSLRVEDPGTIEMTLTITMPLKQWMAIQAQLPTAHPAWQLSAAINDMVSKARKVFWPDETPTNGEV